MLTEHQRELRPHVTNRLAYMLLIFIITCLYYYTQNISIIYFKKYKNNKKNKRNNPLDIPRVDTAKKE